jgi:hypothetical protein
MEFDPDEIAGVVDLFGALTRTECARALAELAYRAGDDHDPAVHESAIAAAVRSYHLVAVGDDPELLVVGPVAFPSLPAAGGDLPHMLDVGDREVGSEAAATAAEAQFRADAAAAVEAGDEERIAELLDVSYELDAWGDVNLGGARERLAEATS